MTERNFMIHSNLSAADDERDQSAIIGTADQQGRSPGLRRSP
jgi:hypothetical protein